MYDYERIDKWNTDKLDKLSHTQMFGFNNNCNAQGIESVLNGIFYLSG